MNISFNKPFLTGKELQYISEANERFMLAGDGHFTKKCNEWIEQTTGSKKALLTHSCTAALEMSAILANIQPGDEIIMPSYTFVSTANAFVLRGGVPVFVDIREDTLNINEKLIEGAITKKTKAIVVVHYAGVACEMDSILDIASRYNLIVIEDAAQAIMSSYKNKPLGSIGWFGCYSFHETKNIISGEGGALIINNERFVERAEIIREKGTDRNQFFKGVIDKYTWQDIGSSFLAGELVAAFLWAQLCDARDITAKRLIIWNVYNDLLATSESLGLLRRPIIPNYCTHNAHMYYVLLNKEVNRYKVLDFLKENNINSVFHYVPLHSSPGGAKYGRVSGSMNVTDEISGRLIRLPLWIGLTNSQQTKVCDVLKLAINNS